jgi:hypothetical protein
MSLNWTVVAPPVVRSYNVTVPSMMRRGCWAAATRSVAKSWEPTMKKAAPSPRKQERARAGKSHPKAIRKANTWQEISTQRRAVVVLGMHRSGTSALTRVISLLGADLPSTLIPANVANEAGFFESNDLMIVHDQLLSSAGSNWQDWRAFNPDWYTSPAAADFKQRVLGVLRHDFAQSRLFVIKDPRVCRFFPFWRDVLEEFGAAPAVVIPVRNPLEVMASLRSRDGFPFAKTALLWLRHVIEAERMTRDLPRAVVTYDALLSDWPGVIASLGAGLGVSWPRRSAATEIEIERFLAAELRHHVATPDALAARAEIVDWVKDTYTALVRLSQMPEHHPSRARLDRVRAEFDKASSVFGVALAETEHDIAQRESERAQLLSQATVLEQRVAAQSDVAINQAAQLAAAIEEVRQSQAERDAQHRRHLLIEAELNNLRSVLHETQSSLSAERQKVAQQSDHIADLDRVRMVAEAKHNEASERVRQLDAEMSTHARIAAEQSALLGSLQLARAQYEERVSVLAQRQRELEALLDHERRAVDDLNTRLADETSAFALKIQEAEQTASAFALKIQEAEQTTSALALKNQQAEQTASALALKNQEAEQTASALVLKNQEAEQTALALALKIQEVEQTASTLALKVQEAEQTASNKIEEAEQTASKLSELREHHFELSSQLACHRMLNQRLTAELEQHKASAASTSRELRMIKRSSAWRIMAPWRNLQSRLRKRYELDLMRRSQLFDAGWYLTEYPDVRKSGVEPAEHYWEHGWLDGRDPSPYFDSDWYISQHSDVQATGINPLIHYILHGATEGRDPRPKSVGATTAQ